MKMLDLVIYLHSGQIGDRRYQFSVKPTYIVAYSQVKGQPMKPIGFWTPKTK